MTRLSMVAVPILVALGFTSQGHGQVPHSDGLATPAQAQEWREAHRNERVIIVSDPRERPVRNFDRIPERWIASGDSTAAFAGKAETGEFYCFQISVFNNGVQPVTVHTVSFDHLAKGVQGVCLNLAVNRDPSGSIWVGPGKIQPLWIGIQSDKPGLVSSNLRLSIALGESGSFLLKEIPIKVAFAGQSIPNHGDDEGWRLARLKWLLPSDLGTGNAPTKQFQPVKRRGSTIQLTSTRLSIAPTGLPSQIQSNDGEKLLATPAEFQVRVVGKPLVWSRSQLSFGESRTDGVDWEAVQSAKRAKLTVSGTAEFDGYVKYRIALEAKDPMDVEDIRLDVPYLLDSSPYQLGLGYRGGKTPAATDWKWNVAYQQDCVWLGDVTVGAQWRFKGANYRRPLVNIYYGFQPLNLPESWGNSGSGGVRVSRPDGGIRLLQAYSGPRHMVAGEKLEFNIDLQITPSRPIDTVQQWATRYYHPNSWPAGTKLDEAVDIAQQDGANVINVHHRTPVNPFINYPFNDLSVPDLKQFVQSAHKKDIRVKLYYTTRELTWQLPEIWAIKSFGDSIIEAGPGPDARTVINPNGANPQLTAAIGNNFIPAWITELEGKYAGKLDISVITRPDSAWTEFYLHGLDWLVNNVRIDGTYIDDTALDRESLKRARRILEAGRPAPLIDLHSWNHEDPLAARGSSTSIYMDLFPYIDRIWLGEGFDYEDATPDYWLVAMSGIPYGVMSEMLQGGGNVWRGMLYGETCRLGWSGDPRSMWKYWDEFGMAGTHMTGWWSSNCPVKTDSPDVLATTYEKNGQLLVAIANWSKQPRTVHLFLDKRVKVKFGNHWQWKAAAIEGFQNGAHWNETEAISVPGSRGWLIEAHRASK